MAKNISLLGADYPDVPAVQLPKTGGGTALFVDEDDISNFITYQDITFSLTNSSGRTVTQSAGVSGYKLIAATFVQNDDLYYTCVTDGIYLNLSITSQDGVQLMGMNKALATSANRSIKVKCVYRKT